MSDVAARFFVDLVALDREVEEALAVGRRDGEALPGWDALLDRRAVLRAYATLLLPVAEAYWLRAPAAGAERDDIGHAIQRAVYALSLGPPADYDVTVVDTRILARAVATLRACLTEHGRRDRPVSPAG